MSVQKKTEPLKTILIITVGFIVIYFISGHKWTLQIALLIGILGLISNYLAVKIDLLWMKLAWLLSLVVPNILLTLFFFIILTPIALLSKVFGKKNQLSIKNTNASLFKEHKRIFDRSYFEKSW